MQPYIAQRLERLFPQIGPVSFDYVWNGYIGITRDFFPRMHRLGPDGFAWAGCNGRAVGFSVALGRELAKAVTGTPVAELALPLTEPTPLPLHGIVRQLAPAMLLPYRYLDSREI
jgi:glycine/D-amino acid oxidase-like deaminating enzyme